MMPPGCGAVPAYKNVVYPAWRDIFAGDITSRQPKIKLWNQNECQLILLAKFPVLGLFFSSARLSGVPDYQMPHWKHFTVFANFVFEYE